MYSLIFVLVFFIIREYQNRNGNKTKVVRRTLAEKFAEADKLDQLRVTKPLQFKWLSFWLVLRAHTNYSVNFLILLGLTFLVSGVWIAIAAIHANPKLLVGGSIIMSLAVIAEIGVLWAFATDRLRLNKAEAIIYGFLGTMFGISCITSFLKGNAKAQDDIGTGFILLIGSTIALSFVARLIPKILGMNQGMVGKAYDVTPTASPELYKLIENTAKSLDLPVPKRILISNTSAMVSYRGKQKLKELRIGIEHIQLLTVKELQSLIAHELEHQKHESYLQLALCTGLEKVGDLPESNSTAKLYEDLQLQVCCMFRANEHDSDKTSIYFDSKAAAQALTRVSAYSIAMDAIFEQSELITVLSPEPPATYEELHGLIRAQPWYPELIQRSRAHAIVRRTLPGETHPCLTERLKTMGEPPPADLTPGDGPMAISLLDATGIDFLKRDHQTWAFNNHKSWMENHAKGKDAELLLEETNLAEESDNAHLDKLTDSQLGKRASSLIIFERWAEALPVLEAYQKRDLIDTNLDEWVIHWIANIKAKLGDDQGIEDLIAQARRNPQQAGSLVSAAILLYLRGKETEARAIWQEMLIMRDLAAQDKAERDELPDNAEVLPHNLPEDEIALLAGTLSDHGVIQHAWVVRRKLKHVPEPEQHVVIVAFWNGPDGRYELSHDDHCKSAKDAILQLFNSRKRQGWAAPSATFPLYTNAAKKIENSRLK